MKFSYSNSKHQQWSKASLGIPRVLARTSSRTSPAHRVPRPAVLLHSADTRSIRRRLVSAVRIGFSLKGTEVRSHNAGKMCRSFGCVVVELSLLLFAAQILPIAIQAINSRHLQMDGEREEEGKISLSLVRRMRSWCDCGRVSHSCRVRGSWRE